MVVWLLSGTRRRGTARAPAHDIPGMKSVEIPESMQSGTRGPRRPAIDRVARVVLGGDAIAQVAISPILVPMPTARPEKLSDAELAVALAKLPDWKLEHGKLHRQYKFADFVAAFQFMAGAALVAQGMDHHPEWSNVWNKVLVDLATHDAGGVTALDVKLAHSMEGLADRQPKG